jgi:hypothetical protein
MEITLADAFLIGYGAIVTYLLHSEKTKFNAFKELSAEAMIDIANGDATISVVETERGGELTVKINRSKSTNQRKEAP